MYSKRFLPLMIVAGALLALGFTSSALAWGGAAQIVGFAEPANVGCYSAQAYTLPAQPPAMSFWSQEYFVPPQPQRAYVQQEVLGYAPQPVAQVNVAYATAQPVVNVQHVKTAAVVGFANPAYATGQAVALRGRFAGNPAVGAVNLRGVAQLNTGQIVGVDRQRVLRPSVFKRRVGAPLNAGNAVVGAVVVGGGY